MKKYVFLIFTSIFLSIPLFSYSQKESVLLTCNVDERTELLSIVFRIAGAEEYIDNDIPDYTREIDSVFSKYLEQPAIIMSQNMRRDFAVGYDAVMSLAVNLKIENGKVLLREDIDPCEIDSRWQCDSIDRYVMLLNDFYRQTDFHLFFDRHKKNYEIAETNFKNNVLSKIKFDWYEKFYGGKPSDRFNVIVSITNGDNNYGAYIKTNAGTEELFAVIGSWQTDSLGFPTYDSRVGKLLIHEFNHSFCNRLINEYSLEMLPKAKLFFGLVTDKMHTMAYGDANTYLCEILVRACVIKYESYTQGTGSEEFLIADERNQGFLWMPELYDALTFYENNRNKYPTLKSFMSEIVKVQTRLEPKKKYKQFIKNQPVIVTNIKNGAQNVNVDIDSIVVRFNKPMNMGNYGSSYGKRGVEYFLTFTGKKAKWLNDKEWVLYVKLKPDTEYSISFPAQFFCSKEGYYRPKETYYLDFKTK